MPGVRGCHECAVDGSGLVAVTLDGWMARRWAAYRSIAEWEEVE